VKKEISGTQSTGKTLSQKGLNLEGISVNFVEKFLHPKQYRGQNTVTQIVNKKLYVVGIEKLNKKRKTYNLYVKDCHEYFANGVLVSNCDALRYGVFTFKNMGAATPAVPEFM
jgi:hypothetical protein